MCLKLAIKTSFIDNLENIPQNVNYIILIYFTDTFEYVLSFEHEY